MGGLCSKSNNISSPADGSFSGEHEPSSRKLPAAPDEAKTSLSQAKLYVALDDFQAQTGEDLDFSKGDILEIINDEDRDWWLAKHTTSGQQGYIPSHYIALQHSLEAEDWYHGSIARAEAEKILMLTGDDGSFLLRAVERKPGKYVLSMRQDHRVRHYTICQQENGGYYLTPRATFASLHALVEHYRAQADGLCGQLVHACKALEDKLTVWACPAPKDEFETTGGCYIYPGACVTMTSSQWTIPRSSIQLQSKLGAGQFGEVWQALWNGTTSVAVKTLKPGSMTKEEFLKEAAVMKRLHHPNIMQLYAVSTDGEPICIVTELMSHGALLEYLQDTERSLRLPQLLDMGTQITTGMAYLEAKNYVHRDLAARNVLVGSNNICKVGNFRLCVPNQEDECKASDMSKIPTKWTAPEAALQSRFSTKSDVWAYGILLTELVTHGRSPYPGMTNAEVLQQLENGYRMPCPPGIPDDLYQIMLQCWHEDPDARPTFVTLQRRMEEFSIVAEANYNVELSMSGSCLADTCRDASCQS